MYGDYDKALSGMKYGLESDVVTAAAKSVLQFGDAVFRKLGDAVGAFALEKVRVTFSANFVTGNSIVASILGKTLTAVVFATDHATTFAALVAAIDAVDGVTVTASDAATRYIEVETAGFATGLGFAITGGASQPTAAYTLPSDRKFGGVAVRVQKAKVSEALGARYDVTEPVPVMTRGGIWVDVADAVSAFKDAFLTTSGAWTDEATNGIATGLSFASSTSGAGLAQLTVK